MLIVDATQAIAATLHDGQQLFVHGGAATPSLLLEALAARAPTLHDVGVVHLHCEGPAPHLSPGLAGHLRHHALFIGKNARQAVNEGRADYIPVFLSDVPQLFLRRQLRVDVAFINVSPPDAHGLCTLGTSVDVAMAAVRAADVVVAQINSAMPRVLGDGILHVDDIDFGVPCNLPPYAVTPHAAGDVEQRIGQRIAELIPDGATLQMGIGGLPGAICAALVDKRRLGIHTEMFSDGVLDLVERGVITGEEKELDRGKIVAAFVVGSPRLYRFLDDNPLVELRSSDYTNDPGIIRRFRKMVAINSAIEIDLTGQVCADSIGARLYSGVGGQVDFMRGAALAEEGRAIIALPATACAGVSRARAWSLRGRTCTP
jgi:4-hydroxybutyrate CoA-transferase